MVQNLVVFPRSATKLSSLWDFEFGERKIRTPQFFSPDFQFSRSGSDSFEDLLPALDVKCFVGSDSNTLRKSKGAS